MFRRNTMRHIELESWCLIRRASVKIGWRQRTYGTQMNDDRRRLVGTLHPIASALTMPQRCARKRGRPPAVSADRELVNTNWVFVLPQPGKAPRRVTKAMTGFWRESIESVPAWCRLQPSAVPTAM
jgi:hypothetical protein